MFAHYEHLYTVMKFFFVSIIKSVVMKRLIV